MKRQSGMSSETPLQKVQKRPPELFSDALCEHARACEGPLMGRAPRQPGAPGGDRPGPAPHMDTTGSPLRLWGRKAEGSQSLRSPPPHRDPTVRLLPLPLCIQQCWAGR